MQLEPLLIKPKMMSGKTISNCMPKESEFNWDALLLDPEKFINANMETRKYVACWNWYVLDCKKDKEIIRINFDRYMEMVPMSQVEGMLQYCTGIVCPT